jgi:DNA-directed RNA polymerase specialized sigma24 family protein
VVSCSARTGDLALRHCEGRSIAEIAQAVGIGHNAAKQHIFRAVRKLRLALDADVAQADAAA